MSESADYAPVKIELRHVSKSFPRLDSNEGIQSNVVEAVLDDFSHTFAQGELTCITGKSGSGKTTLLNLMLSLEVPDSGEILISSRQVATGQVDIRQSCVFQENRLCENLSAYHNVAMVCDLSTTFRGSRAQRLSARSEQREAILDAFAALGLSDHVFRPVSELSGGMRRRVAILRALMAPHDVLFMDEPFTGLDPETKRLTTDYVLSLISGKTVIVITNDPTDLPALGGQVLDLDS